MHITELLLLAVGLSMDACAVAMTDGLCNPRLPRRSLLGIAACFGLMQGLMPLLGYALGIRFFRLISAFDHWIALVLLGFIGIRMLIEGLRRSDLRQGDAVSGKLVFLQGIATSIDALAVGISFSAFEKFRILPSVLVIACVTLLCAFGGGAVGQYFGRKLTGAQNPANDRDGRRFHSGVQVLGGLILTGIGIKIFAEHMWFGG